MKTLEKVALFGAGAFIGAKVYNKLIGAAFAYRTINPKSDEHVVYEDEHQKIICIGDMYRPDRKINIATIVYK